MAAKLTRLNHKIAIQPHLLEEEYTIYSSRFMRPVRKLLDTPSYLRRGGNDTKSEARDTARGKTSENKVNPI